MNYQILRSNEYKDYMASFYKEDYKNAEKILLECIRLSKDNDDHESLDFLYHDMADLQYAMGFLEKAVQYCELAVSVNPSSYESKFRYSRFLLQKANKPEKSLSLVNGIIDSIGKERVLESNHYLARGFSFKGLCHLTLNDASSLKKDLKKLAEFDLVSGDNHKYAVELCEVLMKKEAFHSETKILLKKILQEAEQLDDNVKYRDKFCAHVKKLLNG